MYNDRGNFFLALGPAASLYRNSRVGRGSVEVRCVPRLPCNARPSCISLLMAHAKHRDRAHIHEDVERIYGMHPGT